MDEQTKKVIDALQQAVKNLGKDLEAIKKSYFRNQEDVWTYIHELGGEIRELKERNRPIKKKN